MPVTSTPQALRSVGWTVTFALRDRSVGGVSISDFAATWLFTYDSQLTPLSARQDKLDTTANPSAIRFRTSATWSRGIFGATATGNYVNGYVDNTSQSYRPVSSFFTLDANMGVSLKKGVLKNMRFALSVLTCSTPLRRSSIRRPVLASTPPMPTRSGVRYRSRSPPSSELPGERRVTTTKGFAMLRVWAALLCLILVSAAPITDAVPYSVEDLIALESLGQAMIDPGEHLVVVERRRPHDQASDYGYGPFETRALSNIYVTAFAHPTGLVPLFMQESGSGYWLGGFSPSGKRLSVFRLAHRRLDLGVVDMQTRQVRWFDVAPDLPIAYPAPSWVGDDALVLVTRRDHRLPLVLSVGNAIQSDIPALWAKAATGAVTSATTVTTSRMSAQAGIRDVMRIDLRSGQNTVLASGAITDVSVSSSGVVAVVSTVAPLIPPDTPIAPDYVTLRHVIDVVSGDGHGNGVRIGNDVLPATLAWDEAGHRMAFVSRIAGRDWRQARWQVATLNGSIAIRTMEVAPTIQGQQSFTHRACPLDR